MATNPTDLRDAAARMTLGASTVGTQQYITGPDLQRIIGISESTLRLWRQKGLPHIGGVGTRPRYAIEEVLAWIDRQRGVAPR